MNVHASLKINMPFALILYIYYMQSFLLCVKVYSMVLLNIHLRDGFILLSKEQKKNEQCWNMAYDCIFFSQLLAKNLLFWWDWEWQIYTARLSSALNKSKESLTERSQIHTCGTSILGSPSMCERSPQWSTQEYLFTFDRAGRNLNLGSKIS